TYCGRTRPQAICIWARLRTYRGIATGPSTSRRSKQRVRLNRALFLPSRLGLRQRGEQGAADELPKADIGGVQVVFGRHHTGIEITLSNPPADAKQAGAMKIEDIALKKAARRKGAVEAKKNTRW